MTCGVSMLRMSAKIACRCLVTAAVIGTILCLVPMARSQDPDMSGIGLSGQAAVLDSVVTDGDSVHVIVAFSFTSGWPVAGVAVDSTRLDSVRIHLYQTATPQGFPLQSVVVAVDTASMVIDSLGAPRLYFRFVQPPVFNSQLISLQLEMAVYARNAQGQRRFSPRYVSFAGVGSITPLNNPVDAAHKAYLRYEDLRTYPPLILSPAPHAVIAREFDFLYNQPENAAPGTLVLTITNMDTMAGEAPHRLYLRSLIGAQIKYVSLIATELFDPEQMDSISGGDSLQHMVQYRFTISYQDVRLNPVAFDSVPGVRVDLQTEPPVIQQPSSGWIVPRRMVFEYTQPEDAAAGSLVLFIVNTNSASGEGVHRLYLRDRQAGTGKRIVLDAAALDDPAIVDSLVGGPSLYHLNYYMFFLTYADTLENEAASDTVSPVQSDQLTDPPTLIEPRMGSSRPDSTVMVVYEIPEQCDTVWLTFTADTLSSVTDTNSPHILRLAREVEGPGLVSFFLQGDSIGTGAPNVWESNRGPSDRLVSQCIYNVTLTYGDAIDNESVSVTNYYYVWPEDHTTIPPQLLEPRRGAADNQSFRVVFDLPEQPLPGSVRMTFFAQSGPPDPGSTHTVYLRNIPAGLTGFFLDALHLTSSDLVDSVAGGGTFEQNNTLVDGTRYQVRLYYRDLQESPQASSFPASVLFDNHTTPPVLTAPTDGDTLQRNQIVVTYDQSEKSLPGELKLLFTQIGGPETDTGSPHVLYLSDIEPGNGKSLTLLPAALSIGDGIDSVAGGAALMPRAAYRLRLQYQDTLGNPAGSDEVEPLVYASGTVVLASGRGLGQGMVEPGEPKSEQFRLDLRTVSGESAFRGVRFWVDGDLDMQDVDPVGVRLWSSVDTMLSDVDDSVVDHLDTWLGGEMIFDSFAVLLSEYSTSFFVTIAFRQSAIRSHRLNLTIRDPSHLDCSNDPVIADAWPLGSPDVPLAVEMTGLGVEQDTAYGSLRVWWTVASEYNNAGFILLRRTEAEEEFTEIASYTSHPELVGRGSEPTGAYYRYTDRNLVYGRRYFYRLRAVSFTQLEVEFDYTAEGVPRLPPDNFILGDAYPNPFNQVVSIPYVVPYTAQVEIVIYDLLGRPVRNLVRGIQAPSDYRAAWDGRDDRHTTLPSGVYIVRLTSGTKFDKAKKVLLIR